MRDVAAAVHWMLNGDVMPIQDGGNQLFTHETMVQLAKNTARRCGTSRPRLHQRTSHCDGGTIAGLSASRRRSR